MFHSKLISSYQSLDATEKGRFLKLVKSPMFNSNQHVIQLASALHLLKKITPENTDRKVLFKATYGDVPFDYPQLRRTASLLYQLLEQYFALVSDQEQASDRNIRLLDLYRKRGLEKAYQALQTVVEKQHANAAIKDVHHHFLSYGLEEAGYHNTAARGQNIKPQLVAMTDHLDHFYIASKLKLACNVISNQKVFGSEYQLWQIETILERVETEELQTFPAIGFYYYIYQALSTNEASWFELLRMEINNSIHLFKQEEQRDIYLHAINFCIRKINTGEQAFLRELFEIYQQGLADDALLENDRLSPWTYKNVTAAGLKLKEHQWTGTFIEHYKTKVTDTYRESMYHYNHAKLAFATRQFKEVIRHLRHLEIKDIFTNIDAKVTLSKAWFELNDPEPIEYTLNNLSQFLHRKEIQTYHRKNYSNFIRFTRRMLNLKTFDKAKKERLINAISNAEILTEREWLLAKANEL